MKIDYKKLPKEARYGLPIIPAILISAAIYFFIFAPNNEEINGLNVDVKKQRDEIAKKQMDVKRLPILKKQYTEALNRFDEVKYQLPKESEVSNLLKQVSDNAVSNKVPVLSWIPGANKKKTMAGMDYLEIPVAVILNGSYHNIGRFFASLTSLDRIVNIQDIRLSSPAIKGKEAMLNINFSAVTYSIVEEKSKEKGKDQTTKQ